jgi:hypothetical protein
MTIAAVESAVVYGVRAAAEATYGSGAALTDADYILLSGPPKVTTQFVHDGTTGPDARSAASRMRVRQSGRYATADLTVEVRGAVDMSVSPPPAMDLFLSASGHRRSQPAVSVPTWLYEPRNISEASLFLESYNDNKRYDLRAALTHELVLEATAGGHLYCDAKTTGILDTIAEASAPTPAAYDVATIPMKFDAYALSISPTIGGWGTSMAMVGFKLTTTSEFTIRPVGTISGTLNGGCLGRRTTMLEILVEGAALSAFDPFTAMKNGTQLAVSLSARGNNCWWYMVSELAQIDSVLEEEDGGKGLWRMTFLLNQNGVAMAPYYMWFSQII